MAERAWALSDVLGYSWHLLRRGSNSFGGWGASVVGFRTVKLERAGRHPNNVVKQ